MNTNPNNVLDKDGKHPNNTCSNLKQTNSGANENVSGGESSNTLKRKRSISPEQDWFGPDEKRERVEYSDMEYSSEDEASDIEYPSEDEASSDVDSSSKVNDSSLKDEENLSQPSNGDNTEDNSSVISDLIDIVKDIL